MADGYFEVKEAKNGEFMFNLKAGNNKVILTSETYKTEQGCIKGIESVKKNAQKADSFEQRNKKTKTFVMKAGNHEIIGKSESYKSSSGRKNGINSVKKNAPKAKIKKK